MPPLPSNTPPVNCPTCGGSRVFSNITIAWVPAGDSLLPERGHFCTSCSKPFKAPLNGGIPFGAVRVRTISQALLRLQESADLVVVRHRAGVKEVIY